MPEYIERSDAVAFFENSKQTMWHKDDIAATISSKKNIPTADVSAVKHGEWERKFDEQGIDRGYKCSACRNYVYQMTYEPYLFCPHCGARMDGKDKNNAVHRQ